MVLCVSLQCVIVVFPDHTHLLLHVNCEAEATVFAYKYSKGMCFYTFSPETSGSAVAQW